MKNGFARHVKGEAAAAALVLFLSLSRFTGREGSLVERSSRALAPPQHLYSRNGKYFKYWERRNSDTVFFFVFF